MHASRRGFYTCMAGACTAQDRRDQIARDTGTNTAKCPCEAESTAARNERDREGKTHLLQQHACSASSAWRSHMCCGCPMDSRCGRVNCMRLKCMRSSHRCTPSQHVDCILCLSERISPFKQAWQRFVIAQLKRLKEAHARSETCCDSRRSRRAAQPAQTKSNQHRDPRHFHHGNEAAPPIPLSSLPASSFASGSPSTGSTGKSIQPRPAGVWNRSSSGRSMNPTPCLHLEPDLMSGYCSSYSYCSSYFTLNLSNGYLKKVAGRTAWNRGEGETGVDN